MLTAISFAWERDNRIAERATSSERVSILDVTVGVLFLRKGNRGSHETMKSWKSALLLYYVHAGPSTIVAKKGREWRNLSGILLGAQERQGARISLLSFIIGAVLYLLVLQSREEACFSPRGGNLDEKVRRMLTVLLE